jgi:integrase
LSDVEVGALWRAADAIGHPFGRMVQFLLLTGQRRDEVRKATRGEIDLKAKHLWVLPSHRTKNGREHHVPLGDTAQTLLKALPQIGSADGWLFTLGGAVPVSNLARCKRKLDEAMLIELRKLDQEAELKPWRLHDLRHTLKTWMQKTRIPKDVRNAVQNHFDGDMDQLYGHHSFDEEKRNALDLWGRHIEAMAKKDRIAVSLRAAE